LVDIEKEQYLKNLTVKNENWATFRPEYQNMALEDLNDRIYNLNIEKKYNWRDNNCQHFAEALFNDLCM